jgi:glycosyltransferase involved in cell wall biosynthesis
MKPPTLISVIVPTCYREKLLIDCVDSLVSQTCPSFEIIVIDQAPEPRLKNILEERFARDSRIRYFHVVSAGAARARNIGVANASGSIVAFIDDDARADPGWLEELASALNDSSHPAVVGGRLLPLWTGSRPHWFPRQAEYLLGLYDIGGGRRPMPPADLPIAANMAAWRWAVVDNGGFDEKLGFNYFRKHQKIGGEETILGQRIRAAGHLILYESRAVVRHNVAPHKQTRAYYLRRYFWEGVTVVQQMQLLGTVGSAKWPHFRYHGREICMAIARWLLPAYGGNYPDPNPVVRMLAMGRIAYSLGVLYGLGTRPEEPSRISSKCASA